MPAHKQMVHDKNRDMYRFGLWDLNPEDVRISHDWHLIFIKKQSF